MMNCEKCGDGEEQKDGLCEFCYKHLTGKEFKEPFRVSVNEVVVYGSIFLVFVVYVVLSYLANG